MTATEGSGLQSGQRWAMPRGVIVLLGVAGLVVSVAGTKAFASVIGPTFLALMLTIAVQPLPNMLRRKGWPRWAAFQVGLLTAYAIVLGLALSLVLAIAQFATVLPNYAPQFDELVMNAEKFLQDNGVGPGQVHDMLSQADADKLIAVVNSILQSTLGIFSNLVFLLTILLFMAADAVSYSDRMARLRQVRPDIADALTSFGSGTRKYLVVSTVFGLIVAVFDSGALWLIGIPLPVLWGLLSFITNYIPNVGFVIGLVPPALLGLLDGGWSKMVLVIVVYSVINVVIQSVIQPKFIGDAVGLPVTLTFLSLVFWSWVLGPLGAILAIPLTLLAKALLIDIDPATRWADILLSARVQRAQA